MNLPAADNKSVENIVNHYREFLYSRDYSTPTVKNYLSDLRYLVNWAERRFQGFSFAEITYKNISEYRADVKEIFKGKPSIAARRLSSLKIFVGWSVSQNLLPEEILKTFESGKRNEDDLAVIGRFRTYLLSSGYSQPTIKNYLSDLRHLIDWIANNYEQFKFTALTGDNIRSYRSHLKDRFRTKPSISARRLSSLRKFLAWAGKNGLVTEDLLRSLQKALTLPVEKPTAIIIPPAPIRIVQPSVLTTPPQPVDISSLKIHQKAIHHIKNTRPGWYHRYHSRDWTSTLHTVIMVFLFVAVGSLFLYTEIIRPQLEQTQEQFAQGLGDVLAAATPPRVLSFQGRLTDASDVPISSATNVVFKIYSVRTGGTALWTSKTWSVTPDQNGIFSVCLGGQDTADDCLLNGAADTVIPSTLFAENATLYLGVTAGADAEMTPRQRIAAVSYALNSDALEGFHGSQTPGVNEVPILNASGNLIFNGAATVGSGGGGALTIDSASGTLAIGAGTTTISSGEATLVINATGAVDIQDSVTVDSLTTDTGGITLLAGQAIVPSATGGITIGNASLTALTVTTDGTGNTEVVLPTGSISGTEILDDTITEIDLNTQGTLTDEWCLTYETGGGALFEWQSCGGAGSFSGEVDDTTNGALTFTTDDATPPTGKRAVYADDTNALIINSVTGGTVAVEINDVGEFAFSATGLEFNSNNITGVGNITASGALTIASSGAGNDVVIDGADIFSVLDAATFNLNATFNALAIIGDGAGNDYLEFTEEASNPTCNAGLFAIWANSTDNKLKKCENGTITDLDTTGGGGGGKLLQSFVQTNTTAQTLNAGTRTALTSMSQTVTFTANSRAKVSFSCPIRGNVKNFEFMVDVDVDDNGADFQFQKEIQKNNITRIVSFTWMSGALTAGSHIIKIYGTWESGATNTIIIPTNSPAQGTAECVGIFEEIAAN